MAIEIRVPALGESVTEATIAKWLKKEGEAVAVDEPLVELETDKVTLEVPAPVAGVLSNIAVAEGETVEVGGILGAIQEGQAAAPAARKSAAAETAEPQAERASPTQKGDDGAATPERTVESQSPAHESAAGAGPGQVLSPAVRKLLQESGVDPSQVRGSGKEGRILKGD